MPELLIELRSGEIPATMQTKARKDLVQFAQGWFQNNNIPLTTVETWISPTRMVLVIQDVPRTQPDQQIERKGPRTDAPQKAIDGFLKSTHTSLKDLETRDTPKGSFYFYAERVPGKDLIHLIPLFLRDLLISFTWPKRMYWGASETSWIRPITAGFVLFDGAPLCFNLPLTPTDSISPSTIVFSNQTAGHRFFPNNAISAESSDDYKAKLMEYFLMIDPEDRRQKILNQIQAISHEHGFVCRPEDDLLDEVVGLTEWPTCQIGTFDKSFLKLPPELLIMVMRVHQRYFAVQDDSGQLLPHFIYTSSMPSHCIPRIVTNGNEAVLTARFEDARFYFELDARISLDHLRDRLKHRLFYEGLGTLFDKSERLCGAATQLEAPMFPHNTLSAEDLKTVCTYAKADLSSSLVAEFPELQGVIGSYYARNQHLNAEVVQALYDQYHPAGPDDRLPTTFLGSLHVLLDRMDTLIGFFSLGQKPTGSKDPYALRRAALAFVRILENMETPLTISDFINIAFTAYRKQSVNAKLDNPEAVMNDIRDFIADRLRIFWKEQLGYRYDLIQAVLSCAEDTPLYHLKKRLEQLTQFIENAETEHVFALIRLQKRVVNILKQSQSASREVDPHVFELPEEKALFESLRLARPRLTMYLHQHEYEMAFQLFLNLTIPLADFFEKVTVFCDNKAHRDNRVSLLYELDSMLRLVADFTLLSTPTDL